jgi:hypothetical protein
MSGTYVGVLEQADPLYGLLTDTLGRYWGSINGQPTFDVYRLDSSSLVYRYAERATGVNMAVKFYGNKLIYGSQTGSHDLRAILMHREFTNAAKLRQLGLDRYPHSVVRPLTTSETIHCALVEDFVPGTNLDFHILQAISQDRGSELSERLGETASFLADLHNRSQSAEPDDPAPGLDYLDDQIGHLAHLHVISRPQRERLQVFRKRWRAAGWLAMGHKVLAHGDASPTHFLFDGCGGVTVIDVERITDGDRALDAGCMVAELKHLFFWYSHDPWASEPYIRHFYASYAAGLPGGCEDFTALTTRGRYYMACFLLRICRNAWLDLDYRHRLLEHAIECLKI